MADKGTTPGPNPARTLTWGQKVRRRTHIARRASFTVMSVIVLLASLPLMNWLTLAAVGMVALCSVNLYLAWK